MRDFLGMNTLQRIFCVMCSLWAVALLGEYGRFILYIGRVLHPHPSSTWEGARGSLCSSLSVMETALSSIQSKSFALCIFFYHYSWGWKARFMQTDAKMLMEICYKEPGSCLPYCSFLLFLTHPAYLFSLSAVDLQEPPEPRGFLKLLVNQEKTQPFSGVGGGARSPSIH